MTKKLILLLLLGGCIHPHQQEGKLCVRPRTAQEIAMDDDSNDHGYIVYPGDTCVPGWVVK